MVERIPVIARIAASFTEQAVSFIIYSRPRQGPKGGQAFSRRQGRENMWVAELEKVNSSLPGPENQNLARPRPAPRS